jgi:hypothetical protein
LTKFKAVPDFAAWKPNYRKSLNDKAQGNPRLSSYTARRTETIKKYKKVEELALQKVPVLH